ncbi:hypothetical protein Acr_10g0005610 [Actinidia rufa]|uniref:Uncharacterized protein n=1 Tax=Actinidia rufa TaxID=165716 RepID=A0A7J0F9Q9_9ERIC|nr:hypothetical protein Acr_10g0005610 [Actinidia rufa]
MEAHLLYIRRAEKSAEGAEQDVILGGLREHTACCCVQRGLRERGWGSAMVLLRAQRALIDLTESGLELVAVRSERDSEMSLGTTIGIRAKFKSPESHRSDFGGERKPISNSDQIRSAQKWRLSIPPDSSRRDEAPAPNRVKIGRRTSPHAPPEVSARQIHARPRAPRAPRKKTSVLMRAPMRPPCVPVVKSLILTRKALSEFSRRSGFIREVGFRIFCFYKGEVRWRSDLRALIMLSDADYAPGKLRMKDTEGDEQEDDWHDETSAHRLWTKLEEMYREKTSQNKVLLRRLVLKLQRGTTVAEQTSEFQRATGRGQKKRPEKRSQEGGHRGQEKRRDKKNCPRNKAQDQSSEAATTAMMAVDESDVLLAASADEESDWISDSGIAYHLCRDKEVFSTHVACEGLVRMANDAIVGKGQSASGGTLRVSKGNRRSCMRRKTGRLYRLRENVQTGELLSDIGPVVLARWMDEEATVAQRHAKQAQEYLMDVLERSTVEQERKEMLWDTCGSLARHEKVQPVQDFHEEAQRRETESMHNDRRDVAGTSLFRSRSVAVISPVVHTREERWSHDNLQSDVLCRAPRWGGAGHLSEKVQALRSYGGAGSEVVGMDNLKTTDYPPMGWRGRLLEAAFIESCQRRKSPFEAEEEKRGRGGRKEWQREKKAAEDCQKMEAHLLYIRRAEKSAEGAEQDVILGGLREHTACCCVQRGLRERGWGSAMVLLRAQRALIDLTESGLELVAVRSERDSEMVRDERVLRGSVTSAIHCGGLMLPGAVPGTVGVTCIGTACVAIALAKSEVAVAKASGVPQEPQS